MAERKGYIFQAGSRILHANGSSRQMTVIWTKRLPRCAGRDVRKVDTGGADHLDPPIAHGAKVGRLAVRRRAIEKPLGINAYDPAFAFKRDAQEPVLVLRIIQAGCETAGAFKDSFSADDI